MTGDRYVDRADDALEATYETPLTLPDYVDAVLEDPRLAAHASKYLLSAIEAAGTRTVVEEGERTERYRFFDDPHNDGEHAVLGNTDVLNDLVDDLRSIAAGRGNDESIIWLDGPTATGKSELKRCLVNGLREHSKTPEGRRYTLEWNVADVDAAPGMTYGERSVADEDDWYESPVQVHPLTVFPETVRRELVADLNESLEDHVPVQVDGDLDPFSREAYEYLEEQYRREGVEDLFSAVTGPQHLRVKNYVVDVGRGIGILHSEDEGTPKERLVGSWMHEMLRELDSRGRKNPQAFSYDGVLSQGNGLLTVVEDASQHADLLRKLLNVPDESRVKLDKGIGMDVDTQLIVISNPDLGDRLDKHADRDGQDPLKALKRRLTRHEFTYLTNVSLEAELLHRELVGDTSVWDPDSWEELETWIQAPLSVPVSTSAEDVVEREIAPHTIEAAATYAVVSRLDLGDVPAGLNLVDKALLFDRGSLRRGDETLEIDDFDFNDSAVDGEHGIPVTYTRDVLADLLYATPDRSHPDFAVEHVITPRDVLDAMVEGLEDAPVFSATEAGEFMERVAPVREYVFAEQERDVLDAMMREKRVDTETVEEYVEHVYAWTADDEVETDRGETEPPDPLKMKVFEVEHLGRFDEGDYEGNDPTGVVASFRREKIVTALNRHAWKHRDEEFRVGDVDPREIPVIGEVLGSYDRDDVRRTYEDFDPDQWADPPAGTETAAVKETTIGNMVDMFEYSPASAELASRYVFEEVSEQWG